MPLRDPGSGCTRGVPPVESSNADLTRMRWTHTLIPTMKETPEGAEIPSHVLMLRAGMIAHLTGVNLDRDFQVHQFADLRSAVDGDPCPRCSTTLAMWTSIEVGHIFKLGTQYSEALDARFVHDHEGQHPITMGSYQLGISRIVATVVETSHDPRGIVWPVALAPYEVILMPLNVTDRETMSVAERLYDDLVAAQVDVLLDDRDHRAGVKFHDADLVGIPLRVVVSPRGLENRQIEVKWRWDEKPEMIELDAAAEQIAELIREEREDGTRFRHWQTHLREGNTS